MTDRLGADRVGRHAPRLASKGLPCSVVLAAFAVGALAPLVAGAAQAMPIASSVVVPRSSGCGGVWVVVDPGSLGGVSTKCAARHDTGVAALQSAGFAPTVTDGFVFRISAKPSKPDINQAYWSYWHATLQSDGRYSAWSYSTLGPAGYQPKTGDAEGWRYVSLSDQRTPPQAAPPGSPMRPGTVLAQHQPSATASPAPSSGTVSSTEASGSSGSPVGAIVVGSIVVAAAAGLGGWWMLKGRRS